MIPVFFFLMLKQLIICLFCLLSTEFSLAVVKDRFGKIKCSHSKSVSSLLAMFSTLSFIR